MKIFIIILAIFLTSCKLNKVVNHHGIHNLEAKSQELLINQTNINQIKSLLGPPSSTSYFDEDILIYLERKTSNSKLLKLGKKKLIASNVLLLEVDNRGMLINIAGAVDKWARQYPLIASNFVGAFIRTGINIMDESLSWVIPAMISFSYINVHTLNV